MGLRLKLDKQVYSMDEIEKIIQGDKSRSAGNKKTLSQVSLEEEDARSNASQQSNGSEAKGVTTRKASSSRRDIKITSFVPTNQKTQKQGKVRNEFVSK